jgi:hypothetical protein
MPIGNAFAILKSVKLKVPMVENFVTINSPTNLVFDSDGNLFVVDRAIDLLKITPDGTTTKIASFTVPPTSLAIDASNNIYTVQFFTSGVTSYFFMYKIDTSGAVSAYKNIGSHSAIIIDKSNNIYVSPLTQITKYDFNDIRTLNYGNLPTTGSTLPNIGALCLDSAENIYFSDYKFARIGKIKKDGSSWSFYATTGFVNPTHMCFDEFDNLYIVDNNLRVIKKLSPDKNVSIIAGTGAIGNKIGVASLATFNEIRGIAYRNGAIYISDKENSKIKKLIL